MFKDTCERTELTGGKGLQGVSESHCQCCDPEAERCVVEVMGMKTTHLVFVKEERQL